VDKWLCLWYNREMRKTVIQEGRVCPDCGAAEEQKNFGFNKSGTQKCMCKKCGRHYTLDPKRRAYPEEVRMQALRIYYSGVSGRGVGKVLKMSKANIFNWVKKTGRSVDKP